MLLFGGSLIFGLSLRDRYTLVGVEMIVSRFVWSVLVMICEFCVVYDRIFFKSTLRS